MNRSAFTRLVIREDFLKHNINYLQDRIPDQTRIMAILKNNAYGHGLEQCAELCYQNGVRHFAVYHTESVRVLLRNLPGDSELLLLGYPDEKELPILLRHRVHLTINSIYWFDQIESAARSSGQTARIHLEVETGMERTGLNEKEVKTLLQRGQESPHILITGLYSHLSGDPIPENIDRVQQQVRRFGKILNQHPKAGDLYLHLSNSFGIAIQAESNYEFVRPGITLYGYWSSPEIQMHVTKSEQEDAQTILRPIMRWESTLMDIRTVSKGRFIGYGQTYSTNTESRIGIIPVGYGDGYPKQLENRVNVWIDGQPAPLVGSINMNLMQVDLSNRPDVAVGDTVLLLSDAEGPEELRADRLADRSGRYLYEFLANISPFLPREIE